MFKRLFIAFVLLALVGGGIVGFNMFRDQAIAGFFASRTAPPVPVDTVTAEAGAWTPTLKAIGTVYAARGIELAVETGGVVREVLFKANDRVAQNQVLVRLADDIEQADLAAARAAVTLAQQSRDRVASLGSRGVASDSSIQEAEANLASAQAQARRSEALIEQKVLEAPFAGEVGIPEIEVGQFVAAGAPVATLQDVETLRADFALPEQNLPLIRIGQPVSIRTESGAEASGEITAIEPRIDPATRLVSVRAELDNSESQLSPGQFVHVSITLERETGVVALPQTAVVTSLYGDYVFAVVPQEGDKEGLIARQNFVKLGSREGDRVQVIQGVTPGDRVVIAGQNRLSNGAAVTLSEPGADDTTPTSEPSK